MVAGVLQPSGCHPPAFPAVADASAFIDEGLASGSGVLVHCHAGRSRSCSLVLAWLMTRRRWPLKRALEFLQRMRPEAAPNAGYLAALLRLEEELFGRQTVKVRGVAGVCVCVCLRWRMGMCCGVFCCIPACHVSHVQCSAAQSGGRGGTGLRVMRLPAVRQLTHPRLLSLPARCAWDPAATLLSLQMKKTKPEPRSCPECGERVGLSAAAVRVHIKLKHPGSLLARWVGGWVGGL